MSKYDTKRIELVNIARPFILKDGLAGFTLDDIAAKANLSRPNLLYYFKNKTELLQYAIEIAAQQARTVVVESINKNILQQPMLESLVSGNLEFAYSHPDQFQMFLIFYQMACHDKKLNALNQEIRDIGAKRIADALANDARFYKRTRTAYIATAKMCQSILAGRMIDWIVQNPKVAKNKYTKQTISLVLVAANLKD